MDAHGIMVSMVQVRLAGQKVVWSTVGAACAPLGLERYERLVEATTEPPELQGPITAHLITELAATLSPLCPLAVNYRHEMTTRR
jgi:hypothetical protein